MKKKIISGLVAVCVIVAAIFAYKFAFGNSGTYVKDPSATEVQKAFDTYQRVFDEEHIYFDNIKIADQKEIVSGGHYEN